MKTLRINGRNSHRVIRQAVETLTAGGVIVYPTDTVCGIGCDLFNPAAVRRLLKIKGRTERKGLLLLVNSWPQLRRVARPAPRQLTLLKRYWPGPLTAVLAKHRRVPGLITGYRRTVAVRWPEHKFISKLLGISKRPIVSTSANRSGQPAAHSVKEVMRQFQNRRYQPDLIIDAGRLPDNPPSTIIQFTGRKITVLRQGSLHINESDGQY